MEPIEFVGKSGPICALDCLLARFGNALKFSESAHYFTKIGPGFVPKPAFCAVKIIPISLPEEFAYFLGHK